MLKSEYIDIIRNTIDPGNKNPRYHPRQIELMIEMVYNNYTFSLTPDQYVNADFLTKEYNSQTVTLDTTTNRYYTLLPAPIVPMKIPSEAVRYVGSNQGVSLDFCPMTETTWQLMEGLFGWDTDTTIGYIVRYDRVWFNDAMTADIATAGVRMVLAVPFSSFSYTEHVNLPVGGIDLVQATVQLLMNTQPMDLKNDNK